MSAPAPDEQRATFAERLEAADVSSRRFIDVRDGEKGTRTTGHHQPINWLEADDPCLSGNYGVHPGYGLIEFDVDDYDGEHDTDALDALPETFTVASPHTGDDAPGHRYYAVDDDVREVLEDVAGTLNPEPSWGEIKYKGKYVVGPGSQLDGCTKEWCDECDDPDGGYYRIAEDRPIATLTADDLETVLRADPDIADRRPASEVFDLVENEDTSPNDGDEWITEELAEEALDSIDPDTDRREWIGVGFALVNHFGRATGGSLFTSWSRGGRKWDPADAEGVIDSAGKYPHDIRHFVNVAKRHGWDASSAARAATTAADGGTATASTDAETGVETAGDADGADALPDPSGHGFDRHNGGYGHWQSRDDDKPDEWNEWTNFELEVESFLALEDGGEEIELTVHPRHSDAYTVTVEPTAFNEKRAFKAEVACGRTATFTAGETALARIKRFVGTQTADELKGVRHMGRYDDTLVLPGGTLTTDGWSADPERRYLQESLGLERKVLLSPTNDAENDENRAAAADVLELLPLTRDPERFLPAIGWFYAAPLRPVVMDDHGTDGEFPVLSITGGTGAGKTSTLELLWELLGVGGDPFSANGTNFPVMRNVGATDTLPVWLDEYKPSDMRADRRDGLHDIVRKSTRGGVVSKGNADLTTSEFHLQAPVVVSGEQRFAGPAEQRRSILTTFREATTDPDGEHAHAFARLAGGSYRLEDGRIEHYDGADLTAHAFAYHRWLLSLDDEEIGGAWRSAEERVLSLLDDYGLGDIDSAGRTALQTIVFGVGLYRAFADDLGVDVPIEQADVERALTYVAKQQGNDGRRESHLDEFVRYLTLAAMDNELEEDRHYKRVYKPDGESEIRVNMSRAYPKIARYVQSHGLTDRAELLGEGDYRERINEVAGDDGAYITTYSQNSPPVGRAFGIHIGRASAAVEAFDGDHFYGRDEQGENGRYPSDPDNADEEHWRRG